MGLCKYIIGISIDYIKQLYEILKSWIVRIK